MEDSLASTGEAFPSQDDIKNIVEQKARELFVVCDVENKGFVSKRDMQRLVKELPLMPDQLEEVFDSLDKDKNGFLTLEEFTEGFGGFLGLSPSPVPQDERDNGLSGAEYTDERDQDALDRDFQQAMESLGASGVIAQHDSVKELWKKLQQDEPGLVNDFENFVQHVCADIRHAQLASGELESALKSRDTNHQEDIKNLYEEMETQIRMEKERVVSQEKEKERRVKEQLENDIRSKDEQLQSMLNKQSELEQKLYELSISESEIKEENESLLEQNQSLSELLNSSESELHENKSYLKEIQGKIRKEKRERARNNVQVAQGIMKERESLFAQLEMLKDMNQQLQDDNDVKLHRSMSDPTQDVGRKKQLVKQGSVMSNYFEEGVMECSIADHSPSSHTPRINPSSSQTRGKKLAE